MSANKKSIKRTLKGLQSAPRKAQITLRLDEDVLEWFATKAKATRRGSMRF